MTRRLLVASAMVWLAICSPGCSTAAREPSPQPSEATPTRANPEQSNVEKSDESMKITRGNTGEKDDPQAGQAESPAGQRSRTRFPETFAGMDALPEIAGTADIRANDGKLVRISGSYQEVDVRMFPEGAPVHDGHVHIQITDGTGIALFPIWHRDARRPEDEIGKFKGKNVIVVGTIYHRAPREPSGGASPVDPCIFDVKAIIPVE